MTRKRKKEYVLLLATLVIFLLMFEILLRVLSYPVYGFSKGMFIEDARTGYKMASNYSGKQSIFGKVLNIRTNSRGLRDYREYDYDKSIKRILIIGDSFSFGNGVEIEESYPELLRKNFKAEFEVVNLGVPGYDLHNEYTYFMAEGKKYKPDIILLQFALNDWGRHQITESNGEIRVEKGTTFCVDEDGYLISCSESRIKAIHLSLLRNVRVYSFLYSKTRLLLSLVVSKFSEKGVPLYFHEKSEEDYKEAYGGYSNILKKLKENTNASLIVFIGPFKEDFVYKEEIKEEYNLDYFVDTSQIKTDVEEIADKLGIDVIKIDFNNPDLFLKVDGHWNPEGNRIIADELYLKVKEKTSI